MIRALWVLLLGVVASGGFAPIAKWWLFPLALAFFIIHSINQHVRQRVVLAFLFGLGFFAPMLHWSSSFVGALPWLLLTLMSALFYIPLAIAVRSKKFLWIVFPAFWVSIEFFRNRLPFGGFAWGRAGYLALDSPYSEPSPLHRCDWGILCICALGSRNLSNSHCFSTLLDSSDDSACIHSTVFSEPRR